MYAEGGDDFFGAEDVEALRDAGLLFASDVVEATRSLPADGPRASVYVGVGVAELAPALGEVLLAGRAVRLLTLPGPEPEELNRALAAVGARLGLDLPRVETGALTALPEAGFDHAWFVSVLTDPEVFPAQHDRLYGRRTRAEGATGRGDAAEEAIRTGALLDDLFDRLARPAELTTTDEELPLVHAALRARGEELVVPGQARLSAVVSDPVRVGAWLPGPRGARPAARRAGSGRPGPA